MKETKKKLTTYTLMFVLEFSGELREDVSHFVLGTILGIVEEWLSSLVADLQTRILNISSLTMLQENSATDMAILVLPATDSFLRFSQGDENRLNAFVLFQYIVDLCEITVLIHEINLAASQACCECESSGFFWQRWWWGGSSFV